MTEETFRNKLQSVRMTEKQKQNVWRRAKAETEDNMRKKNFRSRSVRILPAAGAAAAVLLVGGLAVPGFLKMNGNHLRQEGNAEWKNGMDGKNPQQNGVVGESATGESAQNDAAENRPDTYLVLGMDGRDQKSLTDPDAQQTADAIVVVSLDEAAKTVRFLSIPATIPVPDGAGDSDFIGGRIWKEHSFQEAELLVKEWFGIDVDGTVLVSFSGFETLVNRVGGIELEVTADDLNPDNAAFNGYLTENATVTGIGTNGQLNTPGVYILDGPQTLAWCRVDDSPEYGRGERFLTAAKALAKKAAVLSASEQLALLSEILQNGNSLAAADLEIGELAEVAGQLAQSQTAETRNLAAGKNLQRSGQEYRVTDEGTFDVTDWNGLKEEIAVYLNGGTGE